MTFAVNLFSYFCFIIPLTALAVHGRSQVQTLCGDFTGLRDEVNAFFKNSALHVDVQAIFSTGPLTLTTERSYYVVTLLREPSKLNKLVQLEWRQSSA